MCDPAVRYALAPAAADGTTAGYAPVAAAWRWGGDWNAGLKHWFQHRNENVKGRWLRA